MDAERLDYLLSAYAADGLTDAEGRELTDLVRREPAARARLADLTLVHRLLPEAGPAPVRRTADEVLERLRATGAVARAETVTDSDRPAGLRASYQRVQSRSIPRALPWILGVVALAVLIGGVLLWLSRPPAVESPHVAPQRGP